MRLSIEERAVLEAVRAGGESPLAVARMTKLSISTVMVLVRRLRGDQSRSPELLCALDGEPWAVTLACAQMLEETRSSPRPPRKAKRRSCRRSGVTGGRAPA
jgi:hypothetical protein